MPVSSSTNPADRLWGADVARTLAFYAILFFHLTFALWAREGYETVAVPIPPFESYARALAFGGFTVLLVSFFLMGYKPSTRKPRLALWLLAFAVLWTAAVEDFPYLWDIYPFLLVALLMLAAIRRLQLPAQVLIILGATLTSLPFWQMEGVMNWPVALEAPLWGWCRDGLGLGDWPLLPWLGLPLFAFGLGQWAHLQHERLKNFSHFERWLWPFILPVSLPFVASYFATPIGEGFSCFVFRRPFYEFWSAQLWTLALLRFSFAIPLSLPRLARMSVNRHFYLVYFCHYPLCFAAAYLLRRYDLDHNPWTYALAVLSIAAILEYAPVVIPQIFRNNIENGGNYGRQG